MKQAFIQHWKLYLMEAAGLAFFMMSACFFTGFFESISSPAHYMFSPVVRQLINGVLMGFTAILIFYSPFTRYSGAHINPAVTISFLVLKRITVNDAFFYILFQFVGGTAAVFFMAFLMEGTLTMPPVNYAVTVPGKFGVVPAFITEFVISFVMISMILFTSSSALLKRFTKPIAGAFVCLYVIFAGPVSGFGMNPARTFASAFPAHNYNSFWLYMTAPVAGMLTGTVVFSKFIRTKK